MFNKTRFTTLTFHQQQLGGRISSVPTHLADLKILEPTPLAFDSGARFRGRWNGWIPQQKWHVFLLVFGERSIPNRGNLACFWCDSLATSPRKWPRPLLWVADVACSKYFIGSTTLKLQIIQPATEEIKVRDICLSITHRKAIVVTGAQFAMKPTDNVQARVHDQDEFVDDRNINCS